MSETIGKYRIVERIGRGGMGMIFKAHDPMLDRPVALKVIAPEVEVTDELRRRFFREAKACASLNHPNIVTIHDMGEDADRLFIVMELLEGEELRQLIKVNALPTLEDKLSVMVQVCRGLHYAHQRGIVHRDMKPGNIFVVRGGQAKILDFGIAHIATTDAGLTRTGLIMGTLRYISPEQVRGRADQRSDMFSIGSVFYELLTSRPAFPGEDVMQLLEQLRTEDPPAPMEVDPTIPRELSAIVQRAMRKNPDDRFRDLEEMGAALDAVSARLTEDRQRVLVRIRSQREQIGQLQAALAERIGSSGTEPAIPSGAERQGLVAAREAERELAQRIEALQAKLASAEALAPTVESAEALLEVGRGDEAARQFERVVADMPDHLRAVEGLGRARAAGDAQRQRRLAAELLREAQEALDNRRYAVCLDVLNRAADTPIPPALRAQVASLRDTALAGQEALRENRREAEEARDRMARHRAEAQAEDAAQHARALWNEAEAAATMADSALRREELAEAKAAFEEAAAAYVRAQEAARQGQSQERQAAQRARDTAVQERNQSQAVEAAEYARELWEAAEARFAEAQAAFTGQAWARAGSAFTDAFTLYRRAAETGREARERDRRRAEAARARAAEGRRSAEMLDAAQQAAATWTEAVARSDEGEAAWLRKQWAKATERFEAALALYHRAQSDVRALARRQREEAERRRAEMTEARSRALAAEASAQASLEWSEAEAKAAAGEQAAASQAWADARGAFEQAAGLYRGAEERARELGRRRQDAERAAEASDRARRAAVEVDAARHAPDQWRDAERASIRAVAMLSQQDFAEARPLSDEATRLYTAAAQAARAAAGAITGAASGATTGAATGAAASPPRAPVDFDDDATVMMSPPPSVRRAAPVPRRDDIAGSPGTPAPISPEPAPSPPARPAPVPRAASTTPPIESRPQPSPPRDTVPPTPPWFRRPRSRVLAAALAVAAVIVAAICYWWYTSPGPARPVASPPAATSGVPPAAPSAERTTAEPSRASEGPARDDSTKTAPPAAVAEPSRRPSARPPSRVATAPPPRPAPSTKRIPEVSRPPDKGASEDTPLPADAPASARASMIRESVEKKLAAAGLLRKPGSDDPGVVVDQAGANGAVRLVGVLKDGAARQAAADLVSTVTGVTSVDVRRVTVQKGWASQ